MPAFSTLAQGSEINLIPKQELLSPLLREIDIDSLEVILVSSELEIKNLQNYEMLKGL